MFKYVYPSVKFLMGTMDKRLITESWTIIKTGTSLGNVGNLGCCEIHLGKSPHFNSLCPLQVAMSFGLIRGEMEKQKKTVSDLATTVNDKIENGSFKIQSLLQDILNSCPHRLSLYHSSSQGILAQHVRKPFRDHL